MWDKLDEDINILLKQILNTLQIFTHGGTKAKGQTNNKGLK